MFRSSSMDYLARPKGKRDLFCLSDYIFRTLLWDYQFFLPILVFWSSCQFHKVLAFTTSEDSYPEVLRACQRSKLPKPTSIWLTNSSPFVVLSFWIIWIIFLPVNFISLRDFRNSVFQWNFPSNSKGLRAT